MMQFDGLKVLVVGLGESGEHAARLLSKLGSRVTVIDSSLSPQRADCKEELEAKGVEVRLGVSVPHDLTNFELVVTSPGVPNNSPVLSKARFQGLKIVSELELGAMLLPCSIIAVTGTDGKTTTTKLIGEILSRSSLKAVTCGNIGNPITSLYGLVDEDTILVVETSSFQLANIDTFKPHIAIALNIAQDHLDWHRDFYDYLHAKMRIVENQDKDDFLIYYHDDPNLIHIARATKGKVIGYGLQEDSLHSLMIANGWIKCSSPFEEVEIMPIEEIRLPGLHNILNVMAATGAALLSGCSPESVRKAVRNFQGLEHRIEKVISIGNLDFYNDSKATNPHATMSAVSTFPCPFVLIMGGRNKGLDFTELSKVLAERYKTGTLKGLVLFGESAREIAGKIRNVSEEFYREKTVVVDSMDEAVKMATLLIDSGVILFSPACASFDMFSNYKERGEAFRNSVFKLLSWMERKDKVAKD